jgi:hypothetical protein
METLYSFSFSGGKRKENQKDTEKKEGGFVFPFPFLPYIREERK